KGPLVWHDVLHDPISRGEPLLPGTAALAARGTGRSDGRRGPPGLKQLTQDASTDRLVGERRILPPPAFAPHRLGCRHHPVRDRGEIGVAIVKAEDEPRSAN